MQVPKNTNFSQVNLLIDYVITILEDEQTPNEISANIPNYSCIIHPTHPPFESTLLGRSSLRMRDVRFFVATPRNPRRPLEETTKID